MPSSVVEDAATTENSFIAESLDDLLRRAIEAAVQRGEHVSASKGSNRELRGVTLELTRPRARLSRSESRGRVFSALAELLWYLSGSNATEHIAHYIGKYSAYDEDGIIFGGYGPRLRGDNAHDQLGIVTQLLVERPSTRRAVIQLFAGSDLLEDHKDVPCTCTLQFLRRDPGLDLVVYMRSNDVFTGFPHDVFCFTMMQEIVARSINVEMGRYVHMVGSLHLYDDNVDSARHFLDEGWFSIAEMPPMPYGDPMPAIEELLTIEARLRRGEEPMQEGLPADPYWADLANLLVAFELDPVERSDDLGAVRARMNSDVFDLHIADRIERKGLGA
jgi:thymidylate synthase